MKSPSKLTPAVHDKIVNAVRVGLRIDETCRLVGVSNHVLASWRSAGRKDHVAERDTPFARLYRESEAADAERHLEALEVMRAAARGGAVERTTTTVTDANGRTTTTVKERTSLGQWQAAAHFLGTRYPHYYGDKARDNNAPSGGSLVVVWERKVDPAGRPPVAFTILNDPNASTT